MDFSELKTVKTEYDEVDDKSFVKTIIDGEKVYEGNLNTYEFPKVETEQFDEIEDSKAFMKEFNEDEEISHPEIFIKSELGEATEIDNDGYETVFPNIKNELNEEDEDEFIDADEPDWHEDENVEDFAKEEQQGSDVSNTQEVTYEDVEDNANMTPKKYKCEICYYSSSRKYILTNHVKSIHLGIKDHKCTQCSYQTTAKSNLKQHVNSVHLGIKKYKCTECHYRATQRSDLKKHVDSVHIRAKNFKCTECHYRVTHRSDLKKHVDSVHIRAKNFNCTECPYRATQRSDLKKHVNNVHNRAKKIQL
ncbi:hypothetical protein HHI36_022733 [Cryptolaemus montrouzieri]|uniref:C2H2-type domain-containing protein n=1 Tax=Cryptolaemus montrouzieri TaxID=559131 RepID=A0ABD2N0T0_9CUCU